MRLFKRGLALLLALTLVIPAFFIRNEAQALSPPQYTAEYNLTQSSEAAAPLTPPAASYTSNVSSTLWPLPRTDFYSWAYAATAVLQIKAAMDGVNGGNVHLGLNGFGLRSASNRAALTAGLMRHTNPVFDGTELLGGKTMYPVTGVIYIPDAAASALPGDNSADKDIYRDRIKNAVVANAAVVASLYYDEKRLYEGDTAASSVNGIYDNATRRDTSTTPNTTIVNADNKDADHSVVIIGWNDGVDIEYTYEKLIDGKVTPFTVEVPGAFLAYDNLHSGPYWISYETVLTGAYYIDGFYDSASTNPLKGFPLVSQREKANATTGLPTGEKIPKNPLEILYEYDPNGFTGVWNVGGDALYANVFTANGTTAIQAVSVFLTGENAKCDIYIMDNFKDADSLKNYKLELDAEGEPVSMTPRLPDATITATLPGYYTVKLTAPVPIGGKQFAVVAVTGTTTSNDIPGNVPVQRTNAPSNSNGYYWNGSVWSKVSSGQAVCLKAHAEKDVDIALTGIKLPQSKDENDIDLVYTYEAGTYLDNTGTSSVMEDDYDGEPLFKAAPNGSYPLGPAYLPANANDVLAGKTKWEVVNMPYYERDADGWLIAAEDDGKWVAADPERETLTWNASLGLFLPAGYAKKEKPVNGSSAWAANKTKEGKTVSNYIEQPFSLTITANGTATMKTSKNAVYYEEEYGLTVKVYKGKRDDTGAFEKIGGTGSDKDDLKEIASKEAKIVVKIDAEKPANIKLSKTSLSMKANATVTLTAKQFDAKDKEVPARELVWYVLDSNDWQIDTGTGKPKTNWVPYNPADKYQDDGPIAFVDKNGKVTALRDGTCYVFAEIKGGGAYSVDPCAITITKTEPTGVALNKKKMTMSVGTMLTLTASVKPAAASNKGVTWSVEDGKDKDGNPVTATTVATVEPRTGIITAGDIAGTVKVVVKTDVSGYTAECVITVTEGPSATIKKGKSVTYSVLGAASNATVEWAFEVADPAPAVAKYEVDSDSGNVVKLDGAGNQAGNMITGSKNGSKFRVTAVLEEAATTLTATVYENMTDVNGDEIKVKVREQSWNITSVIPISKMAFKDDLSKLDNELTKKDIVKKLTLGIKADKTGGEEKIVAVAVLKVPTATILDFNWTAKPDKNGQEVVTIEPDPTDTRKITITAKNPGSTKITGVNYNGNKKVTISVKVLLYPTADQIVPKAATVTIAPGKSTGVKAKVAGNGVNKVLTYELQGAVTDPITGIAENEFVKLDTKKAKITALKEGKATVIIKGTGGAAHGAQKEVIIDVKPKQTRAANPSG